MEKISAEEKPKQVVAYLLSTLFLCIAIVVIVTNLAVFKIIPLFVAFIIQNILWILYGFVMVFLILRAKEVLFVKTLHTYELGTLVEKVKEYKTIIFGVIGLVALLILLTIATGGAIASPLLY